LCNNGKRNYGGTALYGVHTGHAGRPENTCADSSEQGAELSTAQENRAFPQRFC